MSKKHYSEKLKWLWDNVLCRWQEHYLNWNDARLVRYYLSACVAITSVKWGLPAFYIFVSSGLGDAWSFLINIGTSSLDVITLCIIIVMGLVLVVHMIIGYVIKKNVQKREVETLVVTYSAMIAADSPQIDYGQACGALPKGIVPSEHPFEIKNDNPEQDEAKFWERESAFLVKKVNELFTSMSVTKKMHLSLFALAPMPLLVKLGSLLNEKYQVEVYQKHRNPDNWNRLDEEGQEFAVKRPDNMNKKAVLVFSLSASIRDRINHFYDDNASIWEVTVVNPNMDMLRSKRQQDDFKEIVRDLLTEISNSTHDNTIAVHMAMPVACAVEFGRVWMSKGHKPLELYDYRHGIENKTITIKDE